MRDSFDFAGDQITKWRSQLTLQLGRLVDPPRRSPIGQLAKSVISSRTRDAVSLAAFHRLLLRWPTPGEIAGAPPIQVEREISLVTFADVKARHLVETL